MDKSKNTDTIRLAGIFLAVAMLGLALDFFYTPGFRATHGMAAKTFQAISMFGHGLTQTAILGALVVVSATRVLDRAGSRLLRAAGITGLISFAASGIAAQALKHVIGRARPRLEDIWGFAGPNLTGGLDSLPSGHTVTSFAIAATLGGFFPRARVPLYVAAVLIGISRVALGSHYPLDVAAGLVVGVLCGRAVFGGYEKYQAKREARGSL